MNDLPSHQIASWLRNSAEVKLRVASELADQIALAAATVVECLKNGGKVLLAGNGGSAGDAQHISAEFVGRFINNRPALPAIALTTDPSAVTAIANDYGYDQVFCRQIQALGRSGDVFIAITTSGKSPNLNLAAVEARSRGITTIALLGKGGGDLAALVDQPIIVPSDFGPHIQESHITIGHAMCHVVEAALFAPTVATS